MGLREDILTPEKLEPVSFPCEWGELYIRRMTGAEASEWHTFAAASLDDNGNVVHPHTFRAKLIQLVSVDKDNKQLFTPSDVPAITQKSAAVIAQLFAEACRVNAIGTMEVALARASFLSSRRSLPTTGSPSSAAAPTLTPSSAASAGSN
jgi:hypothetical protein